MSRLRIDMRLYRICAEVGEYVELTMSLLSRYFTLDMCLYEYGRLPATQRLQIAPHVGNICSIPDARWGTAVGWERAG